MHSQRRSQSRWGRVFVLSAGVLFGATARGDQITGIVSFGDSLSDVGNAYLGSGMTQPAPVSAYYQGHFSNGPIWVEYLAKDLGVATPTAALAGGTDYAFGGAQSGTGSPISRVPRSRTSGPRSACIWHTVRRVPASSYHLGRSQ